ncbi:MAG: hypothetical protein ACYT04_65630, partial [Nostoc sp.]
FFCAENAYLKPQAGGVTVIADGNDIFAGSWIYSNSTLIDGAGQIPAAQFANTSGSCSNCQSVVIPVEVAYDCVNGACIDKNTYKTPGLYESISDCEIACGIGCSGKCLSNADWAQIESLSSQIMNKNCS